MSIKQEILFLVEEEELDSIDKIVTAIKHGRVPGISKNITPYTFVLKDILQAFKNFPLQYKNAAIKLALKRLYVYNGYFQDSEAYKFYFENRNKKEALTTYKKSFDNFGNGILGETEFLRQVKDFKQKPKSQKFYEDETWLLVTPENFEASCKYGEATKWCTTQTKDHFNVFNKKGPLFIIINKKTNKKYQFHKETSSFMDELNQPLGEDTLTVFNRFPIKIQEILEQKGFNKWNNVLLKAVLNNDLEKVNEAFKNKADPESESSFLRAVHLGNLEILKKFVENKVNINMKDGSALSFSVYYGKYDVVKFLLKNGAKNNFIGDDHTDFDKIFSKDLDRKTKIKIFNLLKETAK